MPLFLPSAGSYGRERFLRGYLSVQFEVLVFQIDAGVGKIATTC